MERKCDGCHAPLGGKDTLIGSVWLFFRPLQATLYTTLVLVLWD